MKRERNKPLHLCSLKHSACIVIFMWHLEFAANGCAHLEPNKINTICNEGHPTSQESVIISQLHHRLPFLFRLRLCKLSPQNKCLSGPLSDDRACVCTQTLKKQGGQAAKYFIFSLNRILFRPDKKCYNAHTFYYELLPVTLEL